MNKEQKEVLVSELFSSIEAINKELERLRGPIARANLLQCKAELLGHLARINENEDS